MHIVQDIGSYAGLAAVVGLAVLSALYFSQARDVRRLREWAGRAPERSNEQTVQPAARPASGAVRPAPRPAAAQAGARPAQAAQPQGAPQPAAAPANPAAAPAGAPASAAARVGTPATAAAAAGTQAAPPEGKPAQTEGGPPGDNGAEGAAAPAQDKAPVAQEADKPATPPPPAVPSGGAPARLPGRPAPRLPSRPVAGRNAGQTAIIPPRAQQPWYRRVLSSPRYLVLAIAGILILGGAAAFGVTQLSSNDKGTSAPTGQTADTPATGGKKSSGRHKSAAINPSSVTVSVLNGTTVPGLAARIGDQVTAKGFQLGNVTNSASQGVRNESVVLYTRGHEREASAVGKLLHITQREPIDAQSQALGGDAAIVVVTGQDLTP